MEIQLHLSVSKGSNWRGEPGGCGRSDPAAPGQEWGGSAPRDPGPHRAEGAPGWWKASVPRCGPQPFSQRGFTQTGTDTGATCRTSAPRVREEERDWGWGESSSAQALPPHLCWQHREMQAGKRKMHSCPHSPARRIPVGSTGAPH